MEKWEASNTPTIRRLNPSGRHQLSWIAPKAHLAECILKAAAQGHTTYNELVIAAADQIQAILSAFT
jgi:hypothetical protein